jgi:predicted nucleotide-binding protein
MCGGQPVDSFSVGDIVISESEKSSVELLPEIKAEEERSSNETGIGWGLSDEYLVIKNGRNVTRTYVPHPPIKEGGSEKKEKLKQAPSRNVFIVHGHDDKPKLELARMLEKLGFNAIILSEQADKGRTIIEKLEQETIGMGYAFVILTPDDSVLSDWKEFWTRVMADKESEEDFLSLIKHRARQNTILELGYFVGKIGRNRVCCLYREGVEIPSDIHGVLYKKFDKSVDECFKGIVDELKAAGYEIKL